MWLVFILALSNIALLTLCVSLFMWVKKKEKVVIDKETVLQAEKFNTMEQLAVGLAHEIRNPLGIMLQAVGLLESRLSSEKDSMDVLNTIKNNVKRISNTISTFLDFSIPTESVANPPDINSIVNNSLAAIQNNNRLENIEIKKEIPDNLPKVMVDETKIREALNKILLNSVQAMPGGGKIFIRSYIIKINSLGYKTGRRTDDYYRIGDRAIVLEIEDTGHGIPTEYLPRVFEPFFTGTNRLNKGIGLGLWVAKNIIEGQKGLIHIESEEKRGTKVTVKLRMVG